MLKREQEARKRYLKFLVHKGATVNMIARRLKAVNAMFKHLVQLETTQENYQKAVIALVDSVADDIKSEYALFAHEFYTFWMNDPVNTSLFMQHFCFDVESEKSNLRINSLQKELPRHPVQNTYNNQPIYLS